MFKNCPNFGLKIIKITTKSYLDKNHYLIFPQSLKITMILGLLTGSLGSNLGTTRTPAKDSFLRALREVAPEMELFLENHGQYRVYDRKVRISTT